MRLNLFREAIGPALIVKFGAGHRSAEPERIRYLIPKTSWSASHAELIAVAPEDRTEIRRNEILRDLRQNRPSPIWKERLWGTPRDWKLLDRLRDLPPLSCTAGQLRSKGRYRWTIAEGIQPVGNSDDPSRAKSIALPSKLFIPARAFGTEPILSKEDCERLINADYKVRSGSNTDTTVFKGPHVLVSKGLNVSFADFAVSFQDAIKGIRGPRKDRDLLVFLAAYLRSPIARYYLFHTSSRWGMERTDIRTPELLKVPFPLPENLNSPGKSQQLIAAVVDMVDAFARKGRPFLDDREDAVRRLQGECNEILYEYFGIIEEERALIEDTTNIIINSIQPKRASPSLPTLMEASAACRDQYIDLLCSTLNDWAHNGPFRIRGRTLASQGGGFAAVIIDRCQNEKTDHPLKPSSEDGAMVGVLDKLGQRFAKKLNSIELLRGVKIFDKDSLYLFKPLSQRFWTRTAALNDADDIAASILMRSRRERA